MRYRIWHTAALALVIGAQGGLGTADAHASGLIDWMSRCGQPAEPQIVCYPVTAYQTVSSDCCEGSVIYQSPDPACCPPAVVYQQQPQPSFWQRMGACWASPPAQTRYRTSWKKVPVTSYRPVVAADPVTGCPVTVMKPCTTYTWQPRREGLGCGLFGRLFGGGDEPATAVECCMPTVCCDPCGGGTVVSSGCCEPTTSSIAPVPASPAPTPAPYYAPTPPSVLTPSPGSGSPTFAPGAAPGPTLAPGAPPATGGGPLRPNAADVRPSLKPADVSPAPADAESPETGVPGGHAVPGEPTTPDLQLLQPMPSLGPPIVDPQPSRLAPVPDPNATPVSPVEGNDPPPLLHPRDQVASLRTGQHWAVTPIAWPATHRVVEDRSSRRVVEDRAPAAPPRRDFREWDESGWHSARKAP